MVSKDQARADHANTGVWQYAAYANTVMDQMHRMRGDGAEYQHDQGAGPAMPPWRPRWCTMCVRPCSSVMFLDVASTRLLAAPCRAVVQSNYRCSSVWHSR